MPLAVRTADGIEEAIVPPIKPTIA